MSQKRRIADLQHLAASGQAASGCGFFKSGHSVAWVSSGHHPILKHASGAICLGVPRFSEDWLVVSSPQRPAVGSGTFKVALPKMN